MAKKFNADGLGKYLRQHRKAAGVSLEEIATRTKISLRALRALEAEEWDHLPAEIYIRGFIRCYCEVIGLDPNEPLSRFERVYQPHRPREAVLSNKEPLTFKKSRPFLWVGIIVVFLILLVGGYFLFYRSNTPKGSQIVLPDSGTHSPKASPKEGKGKKTEAPSSILAPKEVGNKTLPDKASSLRNPSEGTPKKSLKGEKSLKPGPLPQRERKSAPNTIKKTRGSSRSSKPKSLESKPPQVERAKTSKQKRPSEEEVKSLRPEKGSKDQPKKTKEKLPQKPKEQTKSPSPPSSRHSAAQEEGNPSKSKQGVEKEPSVRLQEFSL